MAFKLLGGVKSYGLGFDSTAYMAGNIFELYPGIQITPVTNAGGGLEGVIPLAPGQLQKLYQPVNAPFLTPWTKEFKQTRLYHVSIKTKVENGEEIFNAEQYYLVNGLDKGFTVSVYEVKPEAPQFKVIMAPSEKIIGHIYKPKVTALHGMKIKKVKIVKE
jgi:hypothetical protein